MGKKKDKSLCKWGEGEYLDDDRYADIVRRPQFACSDCGRVADDRKWLCKPTRLPRRD